MYIVTLGENTLCSAQPGADMNGLKHPDACMCDDMAQKWIQPCFGGLHSGADDTLLYLEPSLQSTARGSHNTICMVEYDNICD
jgi:hypothetical protein